MILTLVIILHLQGKPRVTDVVLDCCVPKIMAATFARAGNAIHDLSASFGEGAHWPSHKHIDIHHFQSVFFAVCCSGKRKLKTLNGYSQNSSK
jgi:hypothetical protein